MDRKHARKQFTPMVKRIIGARQKWRCSECDCLLPASFQIDHRRPLHKGGSNELSNLSALCGTCHAEKSYLEMYEFHKKPSPKCSHSMKNCIYCGQCVSTYFVHDCS